jgi:hypothetical protein
MLTKLKLPDNPHVVLPLANAARRWRDANCNRSARGSAAALDAVRHVSGTSVVITDGPLTDANGGAIFTTDHATVAVLLGRLLGELSQRAAFLRYATTRA